MGADDEWRDPPDERASSSPSQATDDGVEDPIDLLDDTDEGRELKQLLERDLGKLTGGTPIVISVASPASAKEPQHPDKKRDTVGGFSFFLSLFALLPAGGLCLLLSLYTWHDYSFQPTLCFGASVGVGAILASLFIRGHFSVLLHEFKHQIISNLVGNKGKSLVVNSDSGHFEYSYTKKTKHYHAFIALAPYILPLFTFTSGLIAFALSRGEHTVAASIVGIGYGIDLVLNIRDISPVQTDITEIRGGYSVGLLYILAWNIAILGVLLAWVFHGLDGFSMLAHEFTGLFFTIHHFITSGGTTDATE